MIRFVEKRLDEMIDPDILISKYGLSKRVADYIISADTNTLKKQLFDLIKEIDRYVKYDMRSKLPMNDEQYKRYKAEELLIRSRLGLADKFSW